MPRVVVMNLPNGLASSFAIAMDVLGTANAIRRRAGGPSRSRCTG